MSVAKEEKRPNPQFTDNAFRCDIHLPTVNMRPGAPKADLIRSSLARDTRVINDQHISTYFNEYSKFETEAEIKRFFANEVLKDFKGSSELKTKAIDYLYSACHQGGILYPVSSQMGMVWTTGLSQPGRENIRKQVTVESTPRGVVIHEVTGFLKLVAPPGSSIEALGAKSPDHSFEPQRGNKFVLHVEGKLETSFYENAKEPVLRTTRNQLQFGHKGVEKYCLSPKTPQQLFNTSLLECRNGIEQDIKDNKSRAVKDGLRLVLQKLTSFLQTSIRMGDLQFDTSPNQEAANTRRLMQIDEMTNRLRPLLVEYRDLVSDATKSHVKTILFQLNELKNSFDLIDPATLEEEERVKMMLLVKLDDLIGEIARNPGTTDNAARIVYTMAKQFLQGDEQVSLETLRATAKSYYKAQNPGPDTPGFFPKSDRALKDPVLKLVEDVIEACEEKPNVTFHVHQVSG